MTIFMLKMNKKGASLGFNEIKKMASSVFWKIKTKNQKLPALVFFFLKVAREALVYLFLPYSKLAFPQKTNPRRQS